MSDTVKIALIIAVVVVVVLYLFRDRLRSFGLKASGGTVEAELKTSDAAASPPGESRPGVVVRGTEMTGSDQAVKVRGKQVEVTDTTLRGKGQEFSVGQDGDT